MHNLIYYFLDIKFKRLIAMFAPLINVKDKEKVKDFCFGDSVKILIFKND